MMEVHPIDVDFAGWGIVPAGEENAWGIFTPEGEFVCARKDKEAADAKARALDGGDA